MKQGLLLWLLVAVSMIHAYAQTRTITGKVTDATDGSALSGVSVRVKGASEGTSTDGNGNYRLNVPESAGTLVFSFVGFGTQEKRIGGATLNMALAQNTSSLSEIVVNAPYGAIKKTAFTGSESTISARSLEKQRVTSFTRALEGLVPGIVATNGGGQPGTSASIRIRGIGSVNASSSPLYVLDGAPFDGELSSISMDDIETITVLKDAAASSLYGARAANGVVVITTKKGKGGKTKITANVRSGWMNRGIPEYDRVNQQQYYELMWEGAKNRFIAAGQTPDAAATQASQILTGPNALVYNAYNVPGTELVDPATGKLNPNAKLLWNDSWEEALYRTAPRQDVNLNIAGGSEKSDYYLSFGYIDEKGIVRNSGYNRFSTRLNLNSQMTTWLKGGANIYGALAKRNNFLAEGTYTSNPFYYTRIMGPIYPVYQRDPTGNYVTDPITGEKALDWGVPSQMGARPYAGNSNLVGSLALDDRSIKTTNVSSNAFLEAAFLKDFKFRTTLGVNYYDGYGTVYQNSQYGDAANVKGRSEKNNTRQVSYTFNQVLTWNKQFGDHGLNILAGHENYRFESNYLSATRIGFPFPGTSELAPAASADGSTSYTNNHRIEGYFSRLNYNLREKYLLSASYRRDGSSRFFEDARWGNFWSLGGAWRVSQEDFLKGRSWINELKLKTSYGEQGNEDLLDDDGDPSYYPWQSLYDITYGNAAFPGAIISSLPNQHLKWEKNRALNIGVDFALFEKLEGSIEYFNRKSDDLLFNVPLPISTGITSIASNVGALKNYGVELQLGYNVIKGNSFDWRVDVNLTHFKNKITKLAQPEIISGTKKLMVGRSVYDFWLREYAGVDPKNGDALYYQDILGSDGKPTGERKTVNNINQGTYYYHGSALPDLVGGITNSFRYRNFDLSFLLTFQLGGEFYDGNYAALMHPGTYGSNWSVDILNRWQKPGDITDIPRLQNGITNQHGTSSRFLYSATYLNVKNITLSYTLPQAMLNKAGVGSLRIFGSVDNVHLFTKHKGMDPQRAFTGVADNTYVPYRTYTLGLNLNL